jgi:hypothetical protein
MNNTFSAVGVAGPNNSIHFDASTTNCSSINDVFSQTDLNKLVAIGNPAINLFVSPQRTSMPSNMPFALGPVTLADNIAVPASTGITYDTAVVNSIVINYTISRGATRRMSRLTLISDGTTVAISDTGNDLSSSPGITFSATIAAGIITLKYISTSTGSAGTMKYIETKWAI